VLAWSGWFRHLTYATSCRTSSLILSGHLLDNIAQVLLTLGENKTDLLLGFTENELTIRLWATFDTDGEVCNSHDLRSAPA
jgi:hypothetical protein